MQIQSKGRKQRLLADALLCVLVIVAATGIGQLFRLAGFPETNIVIIYLLAVVVTARFTEGFAAGLAASVIATVAFNYFFTAPYHTLAVNDVSYLITFAIMTVVAVLTGTLTSRVKKNAREALQRAGENKALYQLTSHLSEARNMEEIAQTSVQIISETLRVKASIMCIEQEDEAYYRKQTQGQHNGFFKGQDWWEWPIEGGEDLLGILKIPSIQGPSLDEMQKKLLASMIECTAMAMDRFRSARKQMEYREESEKERYRGNLLRAISHDLRTPLSGIMGTSEMIRDMSEPQDPRYELAQGIWDDADWLHSLVENILSLTRIEDGQLALQKQPEAVEEIIGNALEHIKKRAPDREIQVDIPEDLLLVPMDARLIVQVLVNLLDNAIKHTRPEDEIAVVVTVEQEGTQAVFRVADRGDGISKEDLPHIFRMFYTSQKNRIDVKRGMGLGLSICDAIIKAHGGQISARNRQGGGAEICFSLPVLCTEEADIYGKLQ